MKCSSSHKANSRRQLRTRIRNRARTLGRKSRRRPRDAIESMYELSSDTATSGDSAQAVLKVTDKGFVEIISAHKGDYLRPVIQPSALLISEKMLLKTLVLEAIVNVFSPRHGKPIVPHLPHTGGSTRPRREYPRYPSHRSVS